MGTNRSEEKGGHMIPGEEEKEEDRGRSSARQVHRQRANARRGAGGAAWPPARHVRTLRNGAAGVSQERRWAAAVSGRARGAGESAREGQPAAPAKGRQSATPPRPPLNTERAAAREVGAFLRGAGRPTGSSACDHEVGALVAAFPATAS